MAIDEKSVIDDMIVPGTGRVYVLGCFEKRVTFYSQQVRALNLVHALLSEKRVRTANGKVAIVGGGLAGVTAAAAFVRAAPGVQVSVFEKGPRLMHLQRGARDRYVHPHIFDWPDAVARDDEADLPFLNWKAGFARDIVDALDAEFAAICSGGKVQVHTGRNVHAVEVVNQTAARVRTEDGGGGDTLYDAVILCIGFGIELDVSVQGNPSYWAPSVLPASFVSNQRTHSIFISGNGDGGHADFALAAFHGNDHSEILSLVTGYEGLENVHRELLAIDDDAWRTPGFDIDAAYETRVKSLVPDHLLLDIVELLRPDVRILLHTLEPHIFRRDTAILSRFLTFLIIEADRRFERRSIEVVKGVGFTMAPDGSNTVLIAGRPAFKCDVRLFRFGPDRKTNLAPFNGFAGAYSAAHGGNTAHRPQTPVLLPGARSRWAVASAARSASTTPAAAATAAAAPPPGVGQSPSTQINVVHGSVGRGATVVQSYHVGTGKGRS